MEWLKCVVITTGKCNAVDPNNGAHISYNSAVRRSRLLVARYKAGPVVVLVSLIRRRGEELPRWATNRAPNSAHMLVPILLSTWLWGETEVDDWLPPRKCEKFSICMTDAMVVGAWSFPRRLESLSIWGIDARDGVWLRLRRWESLPIWVTACAIKNDRATAKKRTVEEFIMIGKEKVVCVGAGGVWVVSCELWARRFQEIISTYGHNFGKRSQFLAISTYCTRFVLRTLQSVLKCTW
jgi:hypothetical protein